MKYTIDFGYGKATLFTPSASWEDRFYELANQCFGIRKSIMHAKLLKREYAEPEQKLDGEFERLEHSGGDVIVWNEQGEKIKSEWDDEDEDTNDPLFDHLE